MNYADLALAPYSNQDSHLCEVDSNQRAMLTIPMRIIWITENSVEEERMGFSVHLLDILVWTELFKGIFGQKGNVYVYEQGMDIF